NPTAASRPSPQPAIPTPAHHQAPGDQTRHHSHQRSASSAAYSSSTSSLPERSGAHERDAVEDDVEVVEALVQVVGAAPEEADAVGLDLDAVGGTAVGVGPPGEALALQA